MKKKGSWMVCLLLAGIMLLAGCAAGPPKTAAELLERSRKKSPDNYHMAGEIIMGMSAEAAGFNLEFPMTLTMDTDLKGQNTHGTLNLEMELLGQKIDESAEVYTASDENGTVGYSKDKSGTWTKSTEDTTDLYRLGSSFLENASFDEAEFTYDEEAGTYTVATKMGAMMKDEEYRESLKEYYKTAFGELNLGEDQIDGILDNMENADITYVFEDEGYTLTHAKVENMIYEATMEESGIPVKMNVTQTMDFTYSEYGNITDEAVTVPDEVVAAAVEKTGE